MAQAEQKHQAKDFDLVNILQSGDDPFGEGGQIDFAETCAELKLVVTISLGPPGAYKCVHRLVRRLPVLQTVVLDDLLLARFQSVTIPDSPFQGPI